MTRHLSDYWAQLGGTVHPEDAALLDRFNDHGFNLDYPPPAFVGDVVNAPVLILDNNGGYDARSTPAEFPDLQAHHEYRSLLTSPRPLDPSTRSTSPYYLNRNYTGWLASGEAALVNGVAYRSTDGRAKHVDRLARLLPSALFHQSWLQEIVGPLAERGERLVVVHRWSRWNKAADALRGLPNVVFSTAPISKDLTEPERQAIRSFLTERCGQS